MADQSAVAHHRGSFAGWAIVYALAVAYSSLVVGPTGFHFVPLAPETAWRIFKATPYVVNGSDQRPDWMANLLMLVPLGWLATGAFWPRRDGLLWLAAGAALSCWLIFVLAIKYLQVFFPPRTVGSITSRRKASVYGKSASSERVSAHPAVTSIYHLSEPRHSRTFVSRETRT
jgi:hypothetical protein